MSAFHLRIVTPSSDFYSGEIEYLSVDTPDGKMGLMKNALPRVALISAGEIDIKSSVIQNKFICGEGLIIVEKSGVTILTEKCRLAGEEEEPVTTDEENAIASARELKIAKARIAASMKKMKDKSHDD